MTYSFMMDVQEKKQKNTARTLIETRTAITLGVKLTCLIEISINSSLIASRWWRYIVLVH